MIKAAADEVFTDELTPTQQKVAQKLTELYATVGMFISSADTYDGLLIIKTASQRAEEMVRACRHDKRAWQVLVRIANGSDVGSMVIGHTLLLYAIAAHHGRVKSNPMLLASIGYHESQILVQPPVAPEPAKKSTRKRKSPNGSAPSGTHNTEAFTV